jgi:hypothetical protein
MVSVAFVAKTIWYAYGLVYGVCYENPRHPILPAYLCPITACPVLPWTAAQLDNFVNVLGPVYKAKKRIGTTASNPALKLL